MFFSLCPLTVNLQVFWRHFFIPIAANKTTEDGWKVFLVMLGS